MSIAWISHRGESADAPENTLSAFKLSSARDVDGMECDIYFTSDKVVVCAHDTAGESPIVRMLCIVVVHLSCQVLLSEKTEIRIGIL